jgi:Cu/Ag efflux pump CusA
MLTGAIRWSLARPRLAAAAALTLALFAAWYARDMPAEMFPPLAPAEVVVQTDAPGLGVEQVEQLVTRPIENALLGAPGTASVRSQSIQGLSLIRVGLARDADVGKVRQAVAERLAQAAGGLPPGVRAPRIAPLAASGGDTLRFGFTSRTLNPMQLRTVVQYVARPRLLAVAGVANVTLYGGQVPRVEVRARPGDLSDSDLGFIDVIAAVQRASSIAGSGFIDTPQQRVTIDPRGQALSAKDVESGQIQTPGNAPVRIGDVADVAEAPAPAYGDALIMGSPGVLAGVSSQFGAHTLDVTHGVEQALAQMRPGLERQGVQIAAYQDRPASFITGMVRGLALDLAIGGALILVLLLVLLRDPREVLASFLGIPLALLGAVAAVKLLGLSLNAMTLGGLFVALGIVIDDAVIDVEAIKTRLQLAQARGTSRAEAALAAVLEVRTPVIYATLLIDIALLPMLLLKGLFGAFLAPLALTIIVASLASLIVAVALTPAIALLLLGHVKPHAHAHAPRAWRRAYLGWIERRCAHPRWALAALGASAVITVGLLALYHRAALPSFHDARLTVEAEAPAATALDVMRDLGARLTQAARSVPGVRGVALRLGRDPSDFTAAGPQAARLDIGLDPALAAAGQDRAADRLRAVLAGYPQVRTQVRQSLDAVQADAPYAVDVWGQDLDGVDAAAGRIAAGLAALPGSGPVTAPAEAVAPSVKIELNFKRLALYGLSAADVLDTVEAAFQGKTVTQIYRDGQPVDLVVIGPDKLRQDPEGVGRLLLRSSSGLSVPLGGVANVYLSEGRADIRHEAGQRVQTVTAAPAPADASRFAKAADEALKDLSLPPGVWVSAHSTSVEARAGRIELLANSLVAGAAMLGLLLLVFRDGRTAILILASTVFAFLGGAIAVGLTGGAITLGALAGFIALFGLSTRGAIILISRPHALMRTHGGAWTLATVKAAAGQRAAPILLTALMTALAVAPLAFNGGRAAGEILGPMAVVIIGGALSGPVLTLLFLPALMFAYQRPIAPPPAEA